MWSVSSACSGVSALSIGAVCVDMSVMTPLPNGVQKYTGIDQTSEDHTDQDDRY
jgi:hypothetical protein